MDRVDLGFLDFWQTLRRHKFYLLIAAGLGGAVAVAISEGMPVHYTSSALIEIESNSPLVKDMNPTAPPTTAEHVRTQVDILSSRALADAVVRELDLADNPDFKAAQRPPTWIDWLAIGARNARNFAQDLLGMHPQAEPLDDALELFRRRLEVLANERSHIVEVRIQTGSAQLSADAVSALLTGYLSRQVAADENVSQQENQWLTDHLAQLQRAMDEAAQRAQTFRDANGLVDIQAGALPAVQLNEREQGLSAARQDLAKAQSAYDTAMKASQTGSGFVGQEALGSQLIQRLQEREAEILQRIANLRERGGDKSMYLPPVMAELGSVRQQIASETAKIVTSLRRDVEMALSRVSTMQASVNTSQNRARQNVAASATLAQLNQDLDAKRHVYIAFLTRMEQTQLASANFPTVRVVSPPVAPVRSDGMPPWIVAVLGAFATLFLAIAIVLLRYVMGGRIGSAKDVERLTGTAPIASMAALPGPGGMPIPMRILDMTQSGTVETLHALRFAIQSMNMGAPCTHVLVTSSKPEEGKTTLAASLASLSAASGMRVLLVEADLRRPALGRMFRTSAKNTIESLLTNGSRLVDAVHVDRKSGLHCLLASGSAPNVVAVLQSLQFGALMAEVRMSYELVIVDSPPVMHVIDALILSRYADVILFAVACGRTSAATVAEGLRRFPRDVQSRIATVLTRVPQSEEDWRGYYSGYQRKLLTSA
jgi:succinoglycan biosynthesis transport protein ExoP